MNVVQKFVRDYPASCTVRDLAEQEDLQRWDYMIILDELRQAQGHCRDRRSYADSGIAVEDDNYAVRWQGLQELARELYREAEAADKGE